MSIVSILCRTFIDVYEVDFLFFFYSFFFLIQTFTNRYDFSKVSWAFTKSLTWFL